MRPARPRGKLAPEMSPITVNRKALWWLAAFVVIFIVATHKPAIGAVLAVVSAVILDTLTWFSGPPLKKRGPERPS